MPTVDKKRALRSAPFEKGGYGGFAFDPDTRKSKSKSPSIPLFQRGRAMAPLLISNY
jgi:hypothetical protein